MGKILDAETNFPLNFIVVALGLGRTGTDYFMNNKQDKDLCLLELTCQKSCLKHKWMISKN
jgi:hypothetical protein